MARDFNDFLDEEKVVERIEKEAKEQPTKVQKLFEEPEKNTRIIIIAIIAMIIVALIAVIIVFFHVTDIFAFKGEADISQNNLESSYHLEDKDNNIYGSGAETTQKITIDSLFDGDVALGQVDDTKYTSEFTGLTFQPSEDEWVMVASGSNISLAAKAVDLAAANGTGTKTAKLQYFKLGEDGDFKNVDALNNAMKKEAGSDVKNGNITKTIGGISFKGFTYQVEKNGATEISEVLTAKVKGYAVVISVVGPAQKDCDNILKMFS